ncbi:hypothetical protein [Mycobacterium deserti]|uniref:Uncharacterized protein n=1 Tax=Mycobacterium deserti TaxID=2978347 RepID=A0ABT2M777_9MYCO|nr:hypothetical protein [Mycobacterium deserti]MCT7658123.1 hypothetical protein [Mycobacterium deserti]
MVDAEHTLEQVKAVLEPQNWDQTLPTFFCAMKPEGQDDSNWSRVLECVSTECGEYELQTPLKYWKGRDQEGNTAGIYLNYDLDSSRRRANTLVEVDSGYIWVTEIPSGGIRIRTSKALKIKGLSPTATAALACFSGWAQVGIDMVANAADDPVDGTVDFFPSTPPDVGSTGSTVVLTSQSRPVEPSESGETHARLPDLPRGFRQDLIEDTAEQAERYVEVTSQLAKAVVARWKDGLTRDDVQELGELLGTSMTNLSVGAFDSVMANFQPKRADVQGDSVEISTTAPTSERDVIDRLADLARQMITDTKTLAVTAAERLDDDTYTADAMATVASRLAGLVAKSWIDLADIAANRAVRPAAPKEAITVPRSGHTTVEPVRIAGNGLGRAIQSFSELANLAFQRNFDIVNTVVSQQLPEYATVVANHTTTLARRAADQARTVVDDAAKKLDAEGLSSDDLAKTLTRLSDVALINGIELIGTGLVGPGRYETEPITSDYFAIPHADPERRHRLELASPLTLAGGGHEVPQDCVEFDPPNCLLPAGRDTFRIRVKTTGLPSGIYVGAAFAIPLDPGGAPVAGESVGNEVLPIIIGM